MGLAAVVAVAGAVAYLRGPWSGSGAAQAPAQPQAPRGVSVEVIQATVKQVPVQIEALGIVTPMASVAIKARLETEVMRVHFADGAHVRKGDILFTLDSRALEAQIRQAEGTLARSRAQLEGAERDLRRFTELVSRQATPVTNLDNAKTQADIFRAAIATDQALLDNLKVQLSYATIRAPISGRIGTAVAKVGNFVRPADVAPLATIIQIAPIYLTFPVAQRELADLRQALASETATVEAQVPGDDRKAQGQVTLIENTVDVATGTATIRATMPNADELLWPGALARTRLTLRVDKAVSIPTIAVQVGQQGNFVYVVNDGIARVQPVKVARTFGLESVIEEGLQGGETVVSDGHILVTNGARVNIRERKPGA